VLFIVWDLVVRAGWIKAILLPTPAATLGALFSGLAGGALLLDFGVTVLRTLEAFLIAAVVGVPLGVLLGSNERAYRSVEFLIDFFRSTPSSALIPLFLLIFGVSDINKVAIAAFGALLIVVFNSAYGVINARKQRVMAPA
jgi:NitT/TauT family transport system permease protein